MDRVPTSTSVTAPAAELTIEPRSRRRALLLAGLAAAAVVGAIVVAAIEFRHPEPTADSTSVGNAVVVIATTNGAGLSTASTLTAPVTTSDGTVLVVRDSGPAVPVAAVMGADGVLTTQNPIAAATPTPSAPATSAPTVPSSAPSHSSSSAVTKKATVPAVLPPPRPASSRPGDRNQGTVIPGTTTLSGWVPIMVSPDAVDATR